MTTPKKKPRKKSRRVRMAEAVRKEATAALVELGFRNPKKADPSRWADGRLNVFLRWRGADFDEVRFDWDQNNRAMFRVSFNCSRVEASGAEADRAKVLVWFGNLYPGGMSGFFWSVALDQWRRETPSPAAADIGCLLPRRCRTTQLPV